MMMVRAESDDIPWWREEELADILLHQLGVPLLFDLREMPAVADDAPTVLPGTFGSLLFDENPPLPLLRLMKEFAKSSDKGLHNPLPPPVATVLYYAAILAARIRHGAQISALTQQELESGLAWALRQRWIDERTRGFFRLGLDILTARG
jgi:hypothetical protein